MDKLTVTGKSGQRYEVEMDAVIVLFRMDRKKGGEVTAVFPELPANDRGDITCYAHIGQHSACSWVWYYNKTRPAKPAEYAALAKELRQIGYKLVIRHRAPSWRKRRQG